MFTPSPRQTVHCQVSPVASSSAVQVLYCIDPQTLTAAGSPTLKEGQAHFSLGFGSIGSVQTMSLFAHYSDMVLLLV